MTTLELRKQRLSALLYYTTIRGEVQRLTFKFSNGDMVPPTETYLRSPCKMMKLPKSLHISNIEFEESQGKLTQVTMYDEAQHYVLNNIQEN